MSARRLRTLAGTGALAILAMAASVRLLDHVRTSAIGPLQLAPALVTASLRLEGVVVRGAERSWHVGAVGPVRYGDPVPVELTAYCLSGTTRRGRWVRPGIVAADPHMFPLARYLELYVGGQYLGRFLVDDTGGKIHGNRLDIWTPTCNEARRFGRRRGTAVLVRVADAEPKPASRSAALPGSVAR
ncbi:MAG: hypothetical protein JWO05_682 [Gemmatimonadetes bacterium]|nr:hypothetical protein [Gemmatimonadota bacterium]